MIYAMSSMTTPSQTSAYWAYSVMPGITRHAMSALWMAGGMLVSFMAAAVQVNGVALHDHFNHNHLYHVIQMGGMYLFYRGALLLKDR